MFLLTEGGLGYMTSEGPFQPKAFCDSMITYLESKLQEDCGMS